MKAWFTLFAIVSLVAAAFHVIGFLHPNESGLPWRQGLFIGINVLCAIGFWRRPWYFPWAFGVLAVQQVISHGGSALHQLVQEHKIPWLDAYVVLFVVLAESMLIADAIRKRTQRTGGPG